MSEGLHVEMTLQESCLEAMQHMSVEVTALIDKTNELETRNARLQEFVYDMWNDMNVYYTQHESPDSSDMDFYRVRMCELGIEVPE